MCQFCAISLQKQAILLGIPKYISPFIILIISVSKNSLKLISSLFASILDKSRTSLINNNKTPIVWDFNDHPGQFGAQPSWAIQEFNRFINDTDNSIISSSIGITNYLNKEYNRLVNTIPNGVDLGKFNNNLSKDNLSPIPVIGYVGIISPWFFDFELVQKFKQSLPKINLDKIRQFPKIKKTDKKIRVGFVSGDYGNHPISYYLLNTIKHISDEKFELIAYSNSNRMDEITLELKKRFNVWRKINHLSDTEVINLIGKDSVDILFDLSGHTAKNRLSIFVNKAAPVQVTWLGYNASTGLKEIDYIIVDPYVVPLSDQKYFSEKIFQLPNTFQCISINDDIKIDHSRYQNKRDIVFGSFNNLSKINDGVIYVWSEILKKVENSKLFLKAKQLDNLIIVKNIKKKFQKNGINTEKIITEGRSKTRKEMLTKYNQIDIALDPFPYSGITTSLEANWMGVPLLTKKGNNFYSRIGTSINKNLDMEDWIANNEKDYILKAISKASDLEKLFQTKKELRNKFLKSPLSNTKQYAKHFENCLNLMWKTYLEKK